MALINSVKLKAVLSGLSLCHESQIQSEQVIVTHICILYHLYTLHIVY